MCKKKMFIKLFVCSLFLFMLVSYILFDAAILSVHAEESESCSITLEDEKIRQRNEILTQLYGFSYEDLFNVYPGSLSADLVPLSIIRQTGSEAASDISIKDEFFAAMMEAASDKTSAVKYSYRNIYSKFNEVIATPYEKQLDDLTILYINEVFENETTLSNIIREVEDKYSKFKRKHPLEDIQKAFDQDEFNYFLDLYYKEVTTSEELKAIKEKAMGKKDYISYKFSDKLSMAEYYLSLLESYEINYKMVQRLYELQPEDSLLAEGLNRYLINYKTGFIPKFLDYAVTDEMIDKLANAMISKSVDSLYSAGPWEVMNILIKCIRYYYDKHLPSATDITRYFMLDAFMNSVDSGLLELRKEMANMLSNNKCVTKQQINDYEFLYDTKIKTMEMYLGAAKDITKSSLFSKEKTALQKRIEILQQTLEDAYTYDYYVDLCARSASGEDVSEGDFPITYIACTIEENEILDIYGNGKAIYTNKNGEKTTLDYLDGKVFGGIDLKGGTINVKEDSKISALYAEKGDISIQKGITLIADKIEFTNGTVDLGEGRLVSKMEILFMNSKVNGSQGEIVSKMGMKFSDSDSGASQVSSVNLTSKKTIIGGYEGRVLKNTLTDAQVNANLDDGCFTYTNVVVNGKILGGDVTVSSGSLEVDEICSEDIKIQNGQVDCKGDLQYNGWFSCEGENSYITVRGDFLANGYSGGWRALTCDTSSLTAGTLEVQGNITTIETRTNPGSFCTTWDYSFYMGDDFFLKLNGKKEQKISLLDDSKYLTNVIVENDNIIFESDFEIKKLFSPLKLKNNDVSVKIEDAQGNKVTIYNNKTLTGNITVKNADYYQYGNVDGGVTVSGTAYIDGNIDGVNATGDSVIYGDVSTIECSDGNQVIYGNIYEGVRVKNGILTQNAGENGATSINGRFILLTDATLISNSDVRYTEMYGMTGDSKMIVNGNLYAEGYTTSFSSWGVGTYYLNSGDLEIAGDLIIKDVEEDVEHYRVFSPIDTCKVHFLSGKHRIISSSVYSTEIPHISQDKESEILVNTGDRGFSIEEVESDLIFGESTNIYVKSWNGHKITFEDVAGENLSAYISLPSNYVGVLQKKDEITGLKTYVCAPLQGLEGKSNSYVALDKYSVNICMEQTDRITLESNIEEISNLNVVFSSSDESVVSVGTDGTIVANSGGDANVLCKVEGIDVALICDIHVNADHKWSEGKIILEPTHEEEGEIEYICSDCGKTKTEKIDKLPHEMNKVDRHEATVDTEGNIEYYICGLCGKYFSDVQGNNEITYEDTIIPRKQAGETDKTGEIDVPSQSEVPDVHVAYCTHVQTYGWKPYVKDGVVSGTVGESKRLEAIKLKISGNTNVGIAYTTHCQTYGWLPWSSNDELSGTSGEAKRLEAIKIQLTGKDKDKYDIYYRVHAQTYGWLGWAKNGQAAGTAGQAKRLEGIQVVVVKKNMPIDVNIGNVISLSNAPYKTVTNATDIYVEGVDQTHISYQTHVQSYGWQTWMNDGMVSGTAGQAKRLEGIKIRLSNKSCDGGIAYNTHVQSYGWQSNVNNPSIWRHDGQISGTSGQAKRLEAIQIVLTGKMAENYDVYYRVHAQTYGWLGWAKNGEKSGTAGYGKRLEAIQIVLIPKGGNAPSATYNGVTAKRSQAYLQSK